MRFGDVWLAPDEGCFASRIHLVGQLEQYAVNSAGFRCWYATCRRVHHFRLASKPKRDALAMVAKSDFALVRRTNVVQMNKWLSVHMKVEP